MKIGLAASSFDKDIGQGIDKCAGYLLDGVKNTNHKLKKVELYNFGNNLLSVFINFLKNLKILRDKADIFHFITPEFSYNCLFKKPSVVTVYDLVPFILKKERKGSFNLFFKFMIRFVKFADHIIVISESTRRDLIKYLKIPKEKISLIYPGVDHTKFYPKENKKNKNFVVGFLGGLANRKNAKILLDVAELLSKEDILFKIGGKGSGLKELEYLKESKNLKNVEFIGFIPDEDLNDFYNSLNAFIVPTLYDGFTMPGLESMACGCPIIGSKMAAIPEVFGNAGIKINPKNPKEIADAILKLKNSKKLQMELSKKSYERSKSFTWEKFVNETLKVYNDVFSNSLD